ncbi:MAG: DNA polymerase III subunit gamma/tau, partial [Cyanobacteria bacterium P01_D01_bin.128]
MSYEPLHHKYRPQTFAQLIGQDAIATTLANALRQNRVAPAYLFSGPRGTGKTSSARILAKSLNCAQGDRPTPAPCGVCEICTSITQGNNLDVIEIDAASNTGVDNIRELIERSQFAPVQCRRKVYVIDECHMLSTAAFNALLKTLEEPPDHVVFVLATTDPQRVLPTIISRCQRFDFRRIPLDAMVTHLDTIAKTEAIAIHPDALRLVAQMAQGGLRDAESLLDQLSLLEGEITVERVWDLVGAVPERDLLNLVEAIARGSSAAVLDQTRQLMNRGREPLVVLQSLAGFYRDLIIAKTAASRSDLVAITPTTWTAMTQFAQTVDLQTLLVGQQHLRTSEVQVKNTTQPRLWLEVCLLGLLPDALTSAAASAQSGLVQKRSPASGPNGASPTLPPPASGDNANSDKTERDRAQPAPPPSNHISSNSASDPISGDSENTASENLSDIWRQVVGQLQPLGTRALMQQQGRLLSFVDHQARVGISSKPLFRMAKERLPNVEAAFKQVFGRDIKVSFEIAPDEAEPPTDEGSDPDEPHPPAASIARHDIAQFTPPQAAPPPAPPEVTEKGDSSLRTHESESGWQAESELDRAVKSFAQFFNGQVVNLDQEIESETE